MKKLAIALLLLTGCASVPYSIEMVSVGDEVDFQRGLFANPAPCADNGCKLLIKNIASEPQQVVCGRVTCKELVISELSCHPFEEVRLDRKVQEHFREGSRR